MSPDNPTRKKNLYEMFVHERTGPKDSQWDKGEPMNIDPTKGLCYNCHKPFRGPGKCPKCGAMNLEDPFPEHRDDFDLGNLVPLLIIIAAFVVVAGVWSVTARSSA